MWSVRTLVEGVGHALKRQLGVRVHELHLLAQPHGAFWNEAWSAVDARDQPLNRLGPEQGVIYKTDMVLERNDYTNTSAEHD